MPRYDAIVLGSGQAGNPLSQKLADHGFGGTSAMRMHEAVPRQNAQLAIHGEDTAIHPLDNSFRQIGFHRRGP